MKNARLGSPLLRTASLATAPANAAIGLCVGAALSKACGTGGTGRLSDV